MFFPWIVNAEERKVEKDVVADSYAILSHCWAKGGKEISFNTMPSRDLPQSIKLHGACDLTKAAGYKYIWIDSVCMDKTNAVETSQNINSMFDYYQNAEVCFTYLSDVDVTKTISKRFGRSEIPTEDSDWFSRGWTLQELLASPYMCFYDKNWNLVGNKADDAVKQDLQAATKIHVRFLEGDLTFRKASVATRMSWMADRTTTRIEDIAYSMFGVLNVTMDPQYGEGVKAFLRLQRTLLEGQRDESIFAWTTSSEGLKCFSPTTTQSWTPSSWGLLAPSPDCFRGSKNVILPSSQEQRDYGWAQDSVRFMVPQKSGTDVTNWLGLPRKEIKFALNCRVDDGSSEKPTVVLHLRSKDGVNYVRVKCDTLDPTRGAKPSSNRVMGIDQLIRRPLVVGQPAFTISKAGQASDENSYAAAPKSASRLRSTNMALQGEINARFGQGS